MANVELLDLPQELLDRIYSYLDWDQTLHLIPDQSHIRALSLVSKRMRDTVIPTFFRNVSLCLRWQSGTLLEPGLFRLRRQCPTLAQHIRCVHIRTEDLLTSARHHKLPPFVIPADVEDWLDPAATSWRTDTWDSSLYDAHRQHADDLARAVYDKVEEAHPSVEPISMRAEALISHMVGESGLQREIRVTSRRRLREEMDPQRDLEYPEWPGFRRVKIMTSTDRIKAEIDALAVVMLCIPPTLNHLILDNFLGSAQAYRQHDFVLGVTATIMRLFAHRLETLAMAASVRISQLERSADHLGETHLISSELISTLCVLKKLTLAAANHPMPLGGPLNASNLRIPSLSRWLSARTITDLTVCNIVVDSSHDTNAVGLSTFVSSFPALQTLTLKDLYYLEFRDQHNPTLWLDFIVAIRRGSPDVKLDISSLSYGYQKTTTLPACALHWMTEALPRGMSVSFERETRLAEDCESFHPLWEAEASERGTAAAKHRAEVDLVDSAMGTRGIQHNVRQDLGEWITMGE